jgi:2-methylcitrate dehydratase PrpD
MRAEAGYTPGMKTAAERLSEFAVGLGWDDVPATVLAATKLHLLDTIGCGLAARGIGSGDEAAGLVKEQGGRPESTVIGDLDLRPAPSAALANGMLCHGLDYDDTHTGAGTHVSVTVAPAAIAAAEAVEADGRALLVALVAGSEVAIRIGMAAPFEFHHRGFHPTSVCGIFGATAAAGHLLGLSAGELCNAFGIAGSMASGLFEYLSDGSATKPLHAGWAAQGGIQAARLAQRGLTGPSTVFEGRFGLFSAFVGTAETSLELQLSDLGERWETPNIALKPYPACHYSHASLDAVRSLMIHEQIGATDVVEAVALVPADAVAFVLEPARAKVRPRSEYEAKFSLQFSIAAMLLYGRVGVDTFSAGRINDVSVLELARRVTYEVKPYSTYPEAFPGGVRLSTKDGRRVEAVLDYQRGGRGNPMTDGDVHEKFVENAALALGRDSGAALQTAILHLDEVSDLRAAFGPMQRASTHDHSELNATSAGRRKRA